MLGIERTRIQLSRGEHMNLTDMDLGDGFVFNNSFYTVEDFEEDEEGNVTGIVCKCVMFKSLRDGWQFHRVPYTEAFTTSAEVKAARLEPVII